MIEDLELSVLVGSGVLLAAVLAVRLSVRTGFPSLLIYLGLGLFIGQDGLVNITFDDAELTGALGSAALVLILAEGGLSTRWESIRPTIAHSVTLATVGTCVSIAVTAAVTYLILDLGWLQSLLIAAIVGSTDAAAVFSVLRGLPLPRRLTGMLEAESGLNDPPVIIAVLAVTEMILHPSAHHPLVYALEAVLELAIGAAIGLAVGWLGAQGLRRAALPAPGLYPIAVLAFACGAYGAASVAHGSGFLATYVASLVLGNARLPHGLSVRSFATGVGWIAQIGLFVMLGLLATPSQLGREILPAIAVGLTLLLLARPLSVFASVVWFRVPWREQAFLSWAGLRGAVPIVVATFPLAAGVPGSHEAFDLVFVLVVVFTVVQAPLLPWTARRLGLTADDTVVDLEIEASPLGALQADVLQVRIGPASKLHGIEVFELRLPPRASVTLIIRGEQTIVPTPNTMLRHNDDLIIVVPTAVRRATEQRLAEVSVGGKLARWRHPPGEVSG